MPIDGPPDRVPRPSAKPRFEDVADRAPVGGREADVQLVLEVATDPRHRRATGSRGSVDAQPMEFAPVAERRPVAQPAARGECGAFGRLPGEMAAQPRLALAEERPRSAARGAPSLVGSGRGS